MDFRILNYCYHAINIYGVHPEKTGNRMQSFLFYFFLTQYGTMLYLVIVLFYTSGHLKLLEKIDIFTNVMLQGTLYLICLYIQRPKIAALMSNMRKQFWHIEDYDHPALRKEYYKTVKTLRKKCKSYAAIMLLCAVVFFYGRIIQDGQKVTDNMVFKSHIPRSIDFWTMFAWEHIPASGLVLLEVSLDVIVLNILTMTKLQFRLLRYEVEKIFSNNNERSEDFNLKMRRCNEHHTFLLGAKVNDTFSSLMLIYMGVVILILCIEMYLMMSMKQMRAENPGEARLGRNAVFSPEIESQLKEYVLTLAKLFYGLNPKELRRLAFKYAEEHKIKHGFPSNKQAAGKDCLYGFLRRNPEIKLRQPEGTSINRIASFNSESTKKFFANLKVLMDRYHFPPQKIFNMDETGVTVVQKKYPKVYGPKGAKKVGAVISVERGRTITGVFVVSAAGNYCPPMLIYPRKRMSPALQRNGSIGALYACSKNGWINSELFVEWLKHFEKNVNPTETNPVLLILDNNSSHISLEAYRLCRSKFIHMVSLPPHTSDHLQPLDLTFFGP
nr:unnamed protein product [Callosobruchus chinensis]